MKRILALAAIALALVSPVFAVDTLPMTCESAQIGLDLPADTEIIDEAGLWYAYSESAELGVYITETGEAIAPEEVTEADLTEAMGQMDIKDFVYLDAAGDTVLYFYGQGITSDDDGTEWEGFYGILINQDVPDKSYFMAVMAPSLAVKRSGEAAQTLIASLMSIANSY